MTLLISRWKEADEFFIPKGITLYKYKVIRYNPSRVTKAEINIKNVDSKRETKQHRGVSPFTSIIKDQTAKGSEVCSLAKHKC